MEAICDTGRQSTIKTNLRPVRYWIYSTGTYNQHTVKLSAVLLLLSVSLLYYLVSLPPSPRGPSMCVLVLSHLTVDVSAACCGLSAPLQNRTAFNYLTLHSRLAPRRRKRVRQRPRCAPPAFIICTKKKQKNGLSDMSMTSVLLTSVHPGELGFNVVETIGKPYDEWGLFLAAAVVLKRSL